MPPRVFSLLLGSVGLASSSIICPLRFNEREMLLIGDMILDTGSADSILFEKQRVSGAGNSNVRIVRYQELTLETRPISRPLVLNECSSPLQIPRVRSTSTSVSGELSSGGILGLGREKLGDSFLFAKENAPSWKSVSIQVANTLDGSMLTLRNTHLRRTEATPIALNSMYYWATNLLSIRIGQSFDTPPRAAVIFDTGSNFFGMSPRLYSFVTETLHRDNCQSPIVFDLEGQTLTYGPDIYVADKPCRNLAIGKIDQSNFGDLANHEIVIVGTRGLRGLTLSMIKSTKSDQGFYMSIN